MATSRVDFRDAGLQSPQRIVYVLWENCYHAGAQMYALNNASNLYRLADVNNVVINIANSIFVRLIKVFVQLDKALIVSEQMRTALGYLRNAVVTKTKGRKRITVEMLLAASFRLTGMQKEFVDTTSGN